jgi:hypothetical protein
MPSIVSLREGLKGAGLRARDLVERGIPLSVSQRDATLWGPDATPEASIRLGWTRDPREMLGVIEELESLRSDLASQGVSRVILCGMGGSSLAPEVMAKRDHVSLEIVDSTHPDQIARSLHSDLSDAVVVVASKSGTTVETATARAAFSAAFSEAGIDPIERVIIVTDPDSPLHLEASAAGHRVFLADPEVGGRFSALTAFGLVPSTLAGVDTRRVVDEASAVWSALQENSEENPAVALASALSDPARDIAVLIADEESLPGLGDWVEQLVAESTGKDGKGVLPVVAGPHAPEVTLGLDDVVTVSLSPGRPGSDVSLAAPLGAQFLLWEYATAFAGVLLELNPFDQPDVESAKVAARSLLDAKPDQTTPDAIVDSVSFWLSPGLPDSVSSTEEAWAAVRGAMGPSGYLALQLYCDRLAHGDTEALRAALVERLKRPVTIGFGPRFLHSTGQFHKGGTPDGVFVQVLSQPRAAIDIPGYPFDFATLMSAQAAGDRSVLISRGRPVLTVSVDSEQAVTNFLNSGAK